MVNRINAPAVILNSNYVLSFSNKPGTKPLVSNLTSIRSMPGNSLNRHGNFYTGALTTGVSERSTTKGISAFNHQPNMPEKINKLGGFFEGLPATTNEIATPCNVQKTSGPMYIIAEKVTKSIFKENVETVISADGHSKQSSVTTKKETTRITPKAIIQNSHRLAGKPGIETSNEPEFIQITKKFQNIWAETMGSDFAKQRD